MPTSFSSALKSAADNSLAAGQISPASHAAVHATADDPHASHAAEALAAFNVGQFIGSIDWAKLITQLQTIIPVILQLIALFSKPAPATPASTTP